MKIRPISIDELEILCYWQRADSVEGYIYARILQLAYKGWNTDDITLAMGINIEMTHQIITSFNLGGIPAIAPQP